MYSRRVGERKGTLLREFPKVGVPSGHANGGKVISKSPLTVGRAEYLWRRGDDEGVGFGYFFDLLQVKRSFVLSESLDV